jgi:predicted transglutaminase-like cysteine proteinase
MPEQRQQGAVDRRTLVAAALAATSLISARGASAGTKVSQPVVHYQLAAKDGQECDECAHFSAPGACELVEGNISPHGWCRLWTKKTA